MKIKKSLSIYIPLYNEEEGVKNLYDKLELVEKELKAISNFKIILVDDGSEDNTLINLFKYFQKEKFKIISHDKNKNLGGFLKTAIEDCETEYISFLDSDCSYSPQLLVGMFKKSLEGFDIVNASPYHPKGSVKDVGKIRLFLSKSINYIYGLIIKKKIYTTSSICKIYKTELVKKIDITRDNFVAITELFTKSSTFTNKIYEFPCELTPREYGKSKMNLSSNIFDHIKYLMNLIRYIN